MLRALYIVHITMFIRIRSYIKKNPITAVFLSIGILLFVVRFGPLMVAAYDLIHMTINEETVVEEKPVYEYIDFFKENEQKRLYNFIRFYYKKMPATLQVQYQKDSIEYGLLIWKVPLKDSTVFSKINIRSMYHPIQSDLIYQVDKIGGIEFYFHHFEWYNADSIVVSSTGNIKQISKDAHNIALCGSIGKAQIDVNKNIPGIMQMSSEKVQPINLVLKQANNALYIMVMAREEKGGSIPDTLLYSLLKKANYVR